MTEQKGVDTILGEDTAFVGKIESRGTLRVDGRVEGEIVAQDTIIIGPSGVVKADVRAATLSISGQVDGNIKATQKVEIHPTATINGDVQTAIGALVVEPGAKINGHVIMTDERGPSDQQRRAAQGQGPAEGNAPAATPGSGASAQQRPPQGAPEGKAPGGSGGAGNPGAVSPPPIQRRK